MCSASRRSSLRASTRRPMGSRPQSACRPAAMPPLRDSDYISPLRIKPAACRCSNRLTCSIRAAFILISALWTQRETILTESARKQIDKAEKQVGRFLAGRKLSELLTQSGPYHRFVVVAQSQPGYTKKPAQLFPAIAVASTMRDPGFGEAMNAILRTVAFLTGTQAKLKLVEETVDGVKLVGYRFPEDGTLAGDTQNLRFNASPCFAMRRRSVLRRFDDRTRPRDDRRAEKLAALGRKPNSLTAQSRAYAAGGAALAKIFEDQQLTQTVLERAVSVDDARKEVEAGIEFLRGLGVLKLETDFRPHEFRFDIRWEAKK